MKAAEARWRPPLVKICGVTRPEEARRAVELGADLVGINFHPPSPRYVEPSAARRIADAVRAAAAGLEARRRRPEVVGVFVNLPGARVEAIAEEAGLDRVQLHGDEGPEVAARFGARALPVFRVDAARPERPPLELYPRAWGFLFDIRHPSLYGGTGVEWSYRELAAFRAPDDAPGTLAGRPYLVAGGLSPGNAARALGESGAAGIDVCSGVESAPGKKDLARVEQLLKEVRHDGIGTS